MYLQLAEGNRKRGKVAVNSYKRKSSVSAHQRRYPLNENGDIDNPYIFIPNFETGGGVYVREDKFDSMPDNQWAIFMQNIAAYQPEVQAQTLSEPMFLASRASRKQHREEKKENKIKKKEVKTKAKEDRNERKNKKRASKDDARAKKEERKANRKGVDMEKLKSVGGALINKFLPGAQNPEPEKPDTAPDDTIPFYKRPVVVIGAVALTAGAIYLATRPKSQGV